MSSKTILVGLLTVFTAQCAVLKNHDLSLNRETRSVDVPPPPPGFPPAPPPHFHTQQWSGLTRSKDGSQQGVFSGAAAALDKGPQESGEAFSLAASSAKSGLSSRFGGDDCEDSYQGSQQHEGSGRNKVGYLNDNQQQQVPLRPPSGYNSNYGAQSGAYSSLKSFSHYSTNGERRQGASKFAETEVQGNEQQQQQPFDYPRSQNQNSGTGYSLDRGRYASYGSGSLDNQSRRSAGYGSSSSTQSQTSSGNRGQGGNGQLYRNFQNDDNLVQQHAGHIQRGDQGNLQQEFGYGHQQDSSRGFQSNDQQQVDFPNEPLRNPDNQNVGNPKNVLDGALNLASQSLQASQQAGCTTCGKGSYALSNAKSHSGSAVAISVGG